MKLRKVEYFYDETSEITCLRKHVNANLLKLLKKKKSQFYNEREFGKETCF
jgi:hypothetical protein